MKAAEEGGFSDTSVEKGQGQLGVEAQTPGWEEARNVGYVSTAEFEGKPEQILGKL